MYEKMMNTKREDALKELQTNFNQLRKIGNVDQFKIGDDCTKISSYSYSTIAETAADAQSCAVRIETIDKVLDHFKNHTLTEHRNFLAARISEVVTRSTSTDPIRDGLYENENTSKLEIFSEALTWIGFEEKMQTK